MRTSALILAAALLSLGCDATPPQPQPSLSAGSALPTHRNLGKNDPTKASGARAAASATRISEPATERSVAPRVTAVRSKRSR